MSLGGVDADLFIKYGAPKVGGIIYPGFTAQIRNPDNPDNIDQAHVCLHFTVSQMPDKTESHLGWVHGKGETNPKFAQCPQIAGKVSLDLFKAASLMLASPGAEVHLGLTDGASMTCTKPDNERVKMNLYQYFPLLKLDEAKARSYYRQFGYRPNDPACTEAKYNKWITDARAVTVQALLKSRVLKQATEDLMAAVGWKKLNGAWDKRTLGQTITALLDTYSVTQRSYGNKELCAKFAPFWSSLTGKASGVKAIDDFMKAVSTPSCNNMYQVLNSPGF